MSQDPSDNLTTEQVLDRIFKDPAVKHGLSEFDDLGKNPHQILKTFPKTLQSGRAKGEVRYYLKCLKRGEDIQVLSEKKSNPEEIVRQLWLYKLHHVYHYPLDHIAVEYQVEFGTVTAEKAADIVVFQRDGRTAKIVVEVKRPDRKEGINQLKSYLNAEGSPVGVWSNGQERVILYRPYPREFEDTLTEIPTFEQEPKDVLAAKLTLAHLKSEFDFKRIIQNLEELVLANAGVDEFNEIFKIIFAKIYDEKAARDRKNQDIAFRKSDNALVTYETINGLFRKAIGGWAGIFDENEQIKLTPQHLQVVVGPVERIALLGANMRVMDDAFEYLMPSVAKKKNGQFFTPRYVIDMCVKMLNPKKREHVVDPACGSGGFLLHTMEWVRSTQYRANAGEHFIHDYAAKYLWGIDFDERSAKVSRALMLIAGDGRSHVYKLNSLDSREWVQIEEGMDAILRLKAVNLIRSKKPTPGVIREPEAWEHLADFSFDVLLTNPPFAGEIRDQGILSRYELARRVGPTESLMQKSNATSSSSSAACVSSNRAAGWRLYCRKVSSIILPWHTFANGFCAMPAYLLLSDSIPIPSSHTRARKRASSFSRSTLMLNSPGCRTSRIAYGRSARITARCSRDSSPHLPKTWTSPWKGYQKKWPNCCMNCSIPRRKRAKLKPTLTKR